MSSKKDITGRRFGRLTVLRDAGVRTPNGKVKWLCQCDCGKQDIVRSGSLRNGKRVCCIACAHEPLPDPVVIPDELQPIVPAKTLVERYSLQNKCNRLAAENRQLVQQLIDAETRTEFRKSFDVCDDIPCAESTNRSYTNDMLRDGVAVACASDWHCGEVIDSAKVHHKNEYNLEIFYARSQRFFDGASWLVRNMRSMFSIDQLVLWLGGDLITGYIHEDLMETSDLPPTLASRVVYQVLTSGINQLVEELKLERLHVLCNHGNHGRSTQKKRIKTGSENSFEHLMYLFLADSFSNNPIVRFVVASGEHIYFPVYGHMVRWMHGDNVTYNKGIGGVTIPLNRAVFRWETIEHCDLTVFGHFHQRCDAPKLSGNGSLCGYSEFALAHSFEYEPPQQSFFIIDSKRGKCLSTPIWVE